MTLPIKNAKIYCRTKDDLIRYLSDFEFEKPVEINIKPFKGKRSLNQNALFHKWCEVLSKYLISRGRYDWDFEKTKYNLKGTFLGWDEIEQVDMRTGERRVTYEPKHTSDQSVEDMFFFMEKVYFWVLNELGLALPIPDDSEFKSLQDKQNA